MTEREHCESFARSVLYGVCGFLGVSVVSDEATASVADRVERERAAVRVEGAILLKAAQNAAEWHKTQWRETSEKLAAAHAEISDLRVRLDVEHHNHKTEERRADELENKLSAAQAEIERLTTEANTRLANETALWTQLANLRAAAEGIVDTIEEGGMRRRFLAAIEASK